MVGSCHMTSTLRALRSKGHVITLEDEKSDKKEDKELINIQKRPCLETIKMEKPEG